MGQQLKNKFRKFDQSASWLFMALGFIFVLLIGMELFGCSGRPGTSGVFDNNQNQFSSDDSTETSGIFESADGRLNSDDLCYNNESCVELCNSMLKDFSDQKRCYSYQEVDVQAFRDTYNNLALGQNLGDVDSDEMESFLDFGAEMWRDAITGFERDWQSGCEVGADERLSDCQGDDYYLQRGYTRRGAAAALSWIARNDWLAKLLLDYDNDFVVMDALVNVLMDPDIPKKYDIGYNPDPKNKDVVDSIKVFPDEEQCKSYIGGSTANGPILDLRSDLTLTEGRTFNIPCLDQGLNYILLARKYDNEESILLGNRYCSYLDVDYISVTAEILFQAAQSKNNLYSFICNLFRDARIINNCGSDNCTACRNVKRMLGAPVTDCDATGPATTEQPCPL